MWIYFLHNGTKECFEGQISVIVKDQVIVNVFFFLDIGFAEVQPIWQMGNCDAT